MDPVIFGTFVNVVVLLFLVFIHPADNETGGPLPVLDKVLVAVFSFTLATLISYL